MPIVIGGNDMVIYDQQAHISMHELAYKLRHFGTDISILRHCKLDELEQKVLENKDKYDKIWYVTDGVYSMFGDLAPVKRIIDLLNIHKKLHLYVDDAHGMSWAGPNGTGYTFSQTHLHQKMILATSIAKGFGSCGGVFVFKDKETRDKVRGWGGPLTYSGPQEPATVAAAIASAKIHLTDEIYDLQNKLQKKIAFCNEVMEYYKVPLVSTSFSPIFFVGLGLTKMGFNMLERLQNEGFNVNLGIFPAVPETCTGIRFTITNHILEEDIEHLAKSIAYHLPKALSEEDRTMKDIYKAFKKYTDFESRFGPADSFIPIDFKFESESLTVAKFNSIRQLSKQEWNKKLGDNGSFEYDNILLLEEAFSNNDKLENNWKFFYYQVNDLKGENIITTFFTKALSKDDMLEPKKVSEYIEEKRRSDPYFLCSTYFMMGSLLTNGNHLYINKAHPKWRKALEKLVDAVWDDQDKEAANVLYFRDFEHDEELISFFRDHGFIKIEIPENNIIYTQEYRDMEELIQKLLNSKQRLQVRSEVLEYVSDFKLHYKHFNNEDIDLFYNFYLNIKMKSLELNTFDLPRKLFEKVNQNDKWEFIALEYLPEKRYVSMGLCYKTENNYCPIVFGMENSDLKSKVNIYKTTIYFAIKRGLELGAKKIYFGITANETKRKFGAVQIPQIGFVQLKDHYNHDLIENLKFAI